MAGMTRDGPPEVALALLVLEAVLVVEGAGQTKDEGPRTNPAARAGAESRNPGREMALADYYATGGMLAMDELLVAVRLPSPPTGAVAALARVARTPRDQAIVAAVALVAPGVVRVALAGATPKPVRLGEVEARLAVQALTPEVLDALPAQVEGLCEPRGDFRASAEYRRAMAGVLVRRALAQVTRPAPLRFGDHDDG
jgi:CO/xanthine dehydrogenase FAD-binding subunit